MAQDVLGYTTLQVIPSLRDISGQFEGQLTAPLVSAGRSAGQAAGRAVASGLAAAEAEVRRASAALAAARDKEADAAGRVRAAEAALEDLRARGITSGPRLVRAEEALATAQRGAVRAAANTQRAVQDLSDARARLANTTDDAVESESRFGNAISGLMDRIGPAAKQMLAMGAATAGIGSAFELVGESMEREKLNDKLAAQLGATPAMAAEFGSIASELYAGAWGDSLADVNDALKNVWQQGLIDEDASAEDIKHVTALAMDLATVFDQDVVGAAGAVGTMLKTGLAPDAETAMDILTRGFQQGADKGGDLLDTFIEYPALFERLGLTAEEATGILAQGLQAGAFNADKVADALKEFQIRATDGSESSKAAYEALGLSAEEMTAQMAAGGEGAREGLDLVLDRLRAMEDPVARNAAAVGLFGTQAEDLAGALFALDPSEAVAALGDVDGAAARMSDTLNGNAATALEAFKRELHEGMLDALGQAALWIDRNREVALGLGIALGTLAVGLGVAKVAAMGYAVSQGVMAAATGAGTAALAGNSIALGAYTIATGVIRGATAAWAAVQWVLNAAMSANPIGLVVVAIGALVAGVVLAWQHSETFRNVVMGAWSGIQSAVSAAWGFIQPIFSGFVSWITGTLAPAVVGFWQGTIMPAFNAIGAVISWWWNDIASPIFHNLQVLIGLVGAAISAWWHGVAEPAFNAVGAVISWWWSTIVEPAFNLAKAGIGLLGDAISAWWHGVVEPAFHGVGEVVSAVWSSTISPVFDFMKSGVAAVGDAFGAAGRVIESVWNGVLSALRPVAHAIGNVLAGIPGSIGPWEIPGAGTANALGERLKAFRTGGLVDGIGSSTSDSNLALVSRGEYIEPAAAVTPATLPLLEAIRGGWTPTAEQMHAMFPGFARGGLVDAQNWARGKAGSPYQYGGVGNPSWDCSGFQSDIFAILTGKSTGTRYFTTESDFTALGFLPGLGGPNDYSIGVMRGGGGPNSHMAGTLGDLNVESSGSDGVEVGPGAQGAADFPLKWHLPLGGDPGGMLNPGGGAPGGGSGLGLGGGTGAGTGGGASGGASGTGGVSTTRPAGDAVPVWVDNAIQIGNWPSNLGTGTSSAPSATPSQAGFAPGGGAEAQFDQGAAVQTALGNARTNFGKAGEAFLRGNLDAVPGASAALSGLEKQGGNIQIIVADVIQAVDRFRREQQRQAMSAGSRFGG